jgi:hypothetical protein
MNEKEEPRDAIEDEHAPEPPESEIIKGFLAAMELAFGTPKIVTIDRTNREREPNQKRQTDPDILDRMRKHRESHQLQDSLPRPPLKARDPYDVFRSRKKPATALPSNPAKEPGEEEKRIIAEHRKKYAEIQIRSYKPTTQNNDNS